MNILKSLFHKKPEYNFGFIPDQYDKRDVTYKLKRVSVPVSTERKNINRFPYRYDQGDIGSCVGHGISEAFRFSLIHNSQPDFEPSRMFAYYIARDDKKNDTGASIRDAFKAVNRQGLCSEVTWSYTNPFNRKPSDGAFEEALNHQSIKYERLFQNKLAIMDAISSGHVVVYGKSIFESFMTDKVASTGIVPNPNTLKEKFLGGHCMAIFDYDSKGTIELNSWGSSWGQGGVCEVPWDYVLDPKLASDFWVFYLTE